MEDNGQPHLPQYMQEPANPVPGQPVNQPWQPPEQPKRGHKKLVIIIVLLVLIAGAGAGAWVFSRSSKSVKIASTQPASVAVNTSSRLCFIRLAHMNCVDISGKNLVRYDLPQLPDNSVINRVALSPDSKQFVLTSIDYANKFVSEAWLSDAKLGNLQKLDAGSGLAISYPSWSKDGKSILFEGDLSSANSSLDRQIYRYTLATKKVDKLTGKGSNSEPYETKDGHIVYSYYDGKTSWFPYIMDADGSNQKLLGNFNDRINILGWSYDSRYDTVFAFGTKLGSNGNGPEVDYGTATDLTAGKPAKYISTTVGSSTDWVNYIDSTKIVVSTSGSGNIINLADGKSLAVVPHFDTAVGFISSNTLASLTKSAQQTEQPHDRIVGLASAPADFQTYIETVFDKEDARCSSNSGNPGDQIEYSMTIQQVVRDNYALVGEFCGGGSEYYYMKSNGQWSEITATQMILSCDTVNKYKIPKTLSETCLDGNGKEVANSNP